MKNKNFKSLAVLLTLVLSVASFTYVNSSYSNRTTCNVTALPNQVDVVEDEANHIKDSKLPDLKLVKGVITIVEKFFPAK